MWLAVAAVAVAMWVTYARLPASQLYNVSGTGVAAGAGRVLLFLNFPVALIAIAVVLACLERLPGPARWVGVVAIALCLVVAVPGLVRQDHLDARSANAIPALGVALALGLSLLAGPLPLRRPGAARIALFAVAALASLPWLAAEVGVFLPGRVFLTGPHYVHHGHHHGMDGLLLVGCSLLLSLSLRDLRAGPARLVLSAWLALMLAYGVGNMLNDGWDEQVAKRGWARWEFPNVLEPRPTWGWAAILAGAAAVWLAAYRVRP